MDELNKRLMTAWGKINKLERIGLGNYPDWSTKKSKDQKYEKS